MIEVNGHNLYYNTEHLQTPKPTDYNEIIERLRPINSRLFYNIVSSPTCRYETRFAEGRIKDHYRNLESEDRFKNIFTEKILYANPKSFFVNKLNNIQPIECDEIKSVSFTFCEHSELWRHFNARGSEYGICFFHDFLQDNGLRPVEYINQNNIEELKKIVFNSPHLLEVYSQAYNMAWENEWRIKNDLHFTESDIAFVIVPQDRHSYFVEWFMDNEDFQDIQILTSNTFKSYTDHLIFYPQQIDNNWNQVEIFRNEYGKGLKVSPECFNGLDSESKDIFEKKYINELDCLAKNTILVCYEFAYTHKYLRFASRIANFGQLGQLFAEYQTIKDNIEEPIDAQRDLIKALFEGLYREFPL